MLVIACYENIISCSHADRCENTCLVVDNVSLVQFDNEQQFLQFAIGILSFSGRMRCLVYSPLCLRCRDLI